MKQGDADKSLKTQYDRMTDARSHYAEIATRYAEKNDETSLTDAFRRVRTEFAGEINGDRVLDLGCGPGRDTTYFATHGYEAVGVDNVPKMLRIGRAETDASDARYVCADTRGLPFRERSFDAIWAPATLFLLPYEEMDAALTETYRVLRDGGTALIGMKTGDGPEPRDDFGSTVMQYFVDPQEFAEQLVETGFDIVYTSGTVNEDGYGFQNFVCQK